MLDIEERETMGEGRAAGRISLAARSIALLVTLAAAVSTVSGCGGSPEAVDGLPEELFRGIASEWPVLFAPAERWETDGCGDGSWSFRLRGEIVVAVQRPLAEDETVELHLDPTDQLTLESLTAEWDGEPLEVALQADATARIVVPPERLGQGFHGLRLAIPRSEDNPSSTACFERVRYLLGESETVLDTGGRDREALIADLGALGVTGDGNIKRSGMLFVGATRRELGAVRFDQDALLGFFLKNRSGGSATFTLTVDGEATSEVVRSHGGSWMEVPISSGVHDLTLEVEGRSGGFFLWSPRHRLEEPPPAAPVIVVTLDTTRRDILSLYGDPSTKIPHLKELADHSTLYRQAYAAAPWTLPSHASIFTGQYPSTHGAGVTEMLLPIESETLADRYRRAGYLTAGFAGGPLCASRYGLAQGFDHYVDPGGWEARGGDVLDAVEVFLEQHPDQERLFLFVNLFDPHALYVAPEPHRSAQNVPALEDEVRDDPAVAGLIDRDALAWREIVYGRTTLSPPAVRYLEAAYRAEVDFVDEHLGRLIGLLKDRGIYDRSLLIVTSDHGEFLGEGGYYSHGVRLDAELLEIPLLVKRPGQETPSVSDELLSHVDVFRFAAEALPGFGGRDDGDAGVDDAPRVAVLSEEHASLVHPLIPHGKISNHLYALQSLDHRTVVWEGGAQCQTRDDDGWTDAECAESWQSLLSEAIVMSGNDVASLLSLPATAESLNPEERRRLEALGYL